MIYAEYNRHFLDDDEVYGSRVYISMIEIEDGQLKDPVELKANDPLYLLTPNNLPDGYSSQATNYLFEDPISVEFETRDGRKSDIQIRFTIAKARNSSSGGK